MLPRWCSVKNLPANAGDTTNTGLIPGSGRSPGDGNGNPMDREASQVTVDGVTKDSEMTEYKNITSSSSTIVTPSLIVKQDGCWKLLTPHGLNKNVHSEKTFN